MILVFLEQSEGEIPKSSLSAITAALKLKASTAASGVSGLLIGGNDVEKAAAQAKNYGLDTIYTAQADSYEHYLAVPYQRAALAAMEKTGAEVFLAAASSNGKDFCPRVAASIDAAQASDVIEILEDGSFRRPMYAGNILADVELTTKKKVVTIRASAFDPAEKASAESSVEKLDFQAEDYDAQKFVSFDTVASERPDLGEAEVVVSGGRALKSEENFGKILDPLADALGAAIGASRAAVDSGYAPNDWQVGQTGKIVAPKLYIAVGISGAIQHLAGMKESKTIVAINNDAEAPIFEIADYGLVGDLYDAVPKLAELIKKGE